MTKNREYFELVKHYEECYDMWGDCHKGVDWPNFEDTQKRYKVMLQLIQEKPCSLLDFGCGLGHMLEFIQRNSIQDIEYTGADLSKKFVATCRSKFPGYRFLEIDILEDELPESYDYIVANGVFTEKRSLTFESMWDFFTSTLKNLFQSCNKGLAFNVMSKQVDWERDDLFHVPLDDLANFLWKNLSRHFVIRNDYGLYEYTTYVYKKPTVSPSA